MQKSDLNQIGKLVRSIVREEVEAEIKDSTNNLESQIRISGMRIQNDIGDLDDRMKNVEIRVDKVKGKLDKVDKKIDKVHSGLKRDIKYIVHILDKENIRTATRVRRIEEHLGLSSNV